MVYLVYADRADAVVVVELIAGDGALKQVRGARNVKIVPYLVINALNSPFLGLHYPLLTLLSLRYITFPSVGH